MLASHNHLSVNDCYLKLSYLYEFVTLYDLDELIVPRFYDSSTLINSSDVYKCDDTNRICSLKPVSLKMYDYFKLLIKNNFKHDISKLRSIKFDHAVYLLPNDLQFSLMEKIRHLAQRLTEGNSYLSFPVKVSMGNGGNSHTLLVHETDKEYVIYLSKVYEAFKCYYNTLVNNITKFDHNYYRYMYFITGEKKRLPKSVSYTKNVYGLFTHCPLHFKKGSIVLKAPSSDLHVNSHYRLHINSFINSPGENSIKNLGFDFEFIFFLLKKFTQYCHS